MTAEVGVLLFERVDQGLQALERQLLDAARLLLDPLLELLVVHAIFENEAPLVERLHHARAHLVEVERLRDVVERTELQAGDRALHLGHRRHHDDRRVGPAADHLAQQRDAVHLRHPQVGDDERHGLVPHHLQRLGAGARLVADEPLAFQQAHEHAAQPRLVVYDEAVHGVGLGHLR